MAKVPVTELPIHVYVCVTDPARDAIALIGNLPVRFSGKTPMQARKTAEDFRRREVERLRRRDLAKEARLEGARRAREERHADP